MSRVLPVCPTKRAGGPSLLFFLTGSPWRAGKVDLLSCSGLKNREVEVLHLECASAGPFDLTCALAA